MTQIFIIGFIKTLLNHCEGYPEDIDDQFDDDAYNISLNGAVFDTKKGVIFKLSADNRVVKAYRGFTKLSEEEIDEIFGGDRKYEFSQWNLRDYKNGVIGFHTFFDTPLLCVLSKILELKAQGRIDKSWTDIFEDIKTWVMKNYVHYTNDHVTKISEYGYFFPKILENPEKYIQKRDDFREMLIRIRNMGKKTFLATNSHAEYTELIMSNSIGSDWMDYFDLVACNWGKPIFFKDESTERHFFELDKTSPDFRGKRCENALDLSPDKIYLDGNVHDLEDYFASVIPGHPEDQKASFVYFGDNYISKLFLFL